MTDAKAPERIWASAVYMDSEPYAWEYGSWENHEWNSAVVQYIRFDLYDALAQQRDELQAENERLTKLVSDSEKERYRSCGELLQRAEKAEAEVERLREALEKAARALEYTHYLGDAKTARAALQRKEGDE